MRSVICSPSSPFDKDVNSTASQQSTCYIHTRALSRICVGLSFRWLFRSKFVPTRGEQTDVTRSFVFRASRLSKQIALPLGFSSSWPRCANVCNYWTAVRQEEEDQHSKAEAAMMVMQRPVHHGATSGGNTHHHHQEIARSSVVAIG